MTDLKIIKAMVDEAEAFANTMSKDRIRADEYYRGVMKDTPSDVGRSSITTRDVRIAIRRILPSILRTILGAEAVVEYQPVGPNDEDGARQASDYINLVVLDECGGRKAIHDAIHDALLLRNGVLKWWYEEKRSVSISTHTGLPDEAFYELAGDDSVDVLEHTERQEMVEQGEAMAPVTVHDCKIRRNIVKREPRAAAVPRERFLIHPDAVTMCDSLLVGEKTTLRRSDLIAMGYDRDVIDGLPASDEDEVEENIRRDIAARSDVEDAASEEIDYYDLFVRIDADGDGINELHHICFAGGLGEKNLLSDDDVDEVQFCDIAAIRMPHQWEGVSIFDEMSDIQQTKTILKRQTLDNIYWQNNPQPIMQHGAIKNPDAVYTPEFGKPIITRDGSDVRAAMGFNTVPFVAANSFQMIEYVDREAQDRTGISEASAGLAPDALQNMTAKASAMIEQGGIGQTEMIVRTIAESLKPFFKGLLSLIIRHQDVPRTIRLRDEWVQFDPRDWNADMDCTINTGLGAGTRERDMMMMQQVIGLQEKLLASFGAADNPFVSPENLFNALKRMAEAAGLKSPAQYFTQPDAQAMQQRMEAMKNAPSPEQMKAQAQAQIEQMKAEAQAKLKEAELQMTMQIEKARMEVARDKEMAQMQADLQVKQAERETQVLLADKELDFRRAELLAEQRLEYTKLGLDVAADGNPVNQHALDMAATMQQVIGMLGQIGTHFAEAAKPKRVIRDANGDIVGVGPADPMMN